MIESCAPQTTADWIGWATYVLKGNASEASDAIQRVQAEMERLRKTEVSKKELDNSRTYNDELRGCLDAVCDALQLSGCPSYHDLHRHVADLMSMKPDAEEWRKLTAGSGVAITAHEHRVLKEDAEKWRHLLRDRKAAGIAWDGELKGKMVTMITAEELRDLQLAAGEYS